MEEGHVPNAPSRRQLVGLTAAALVAATAIFMLTVLPAEFGMDPSGFGRLVGLNRLAGPTEIQVAASQPGESEPTFYSDVPFRSDAVDIALKRGGTFLADDTEWKVRMKKGATLIYSWSVPGVVVQDEFYFSFHGQSEPEPGAIKPEVKVTTFREDVGTSQNGSLVAPYDGLWGWYLQNQTDHAVVVHMQVAGYYQIATKEEIDRAAAAVPPPAPPE